MTRINPCYNFSLREEVQETLQDENRPGKACLSAKIDKIGGKPKYNEVHQAKLQATKQYRMKERDGGRLNGFFKSNQPNIPTRKQQPYKTGN